MLPPVWMVSPAPISGYSRFHKRYWKRSLSAVTKPTVGAGKCIGNSSVSDPNHCGEDGREVSRWTRHCSVS
jgi:hypothetical protein